VPEPIDTIRRVSSDGTMSVDELQAALTVLNEHRYSGKVDVLQARRRVLQQMKERGVEAAPTAAAQPTRVRISDSGAATSPGSATIQDRIFTGDLRPPKPQQQKSGNPILGFIVLLLLAGSVLYACNRGDSASGDGTDSGASTSDSGPEGGSEGGSDSVGLADRTGFAWEACKTAVENELKAPSTADFQSVFGAQFRGAATDTVVVGAYVDSENSFGAMLRADWICSATFTPGSTDVESATVISISPR
jgi:hypothetical protein